ncbi:tape-measure protein [Streptomyces hyaluromycini]|uniref:tape-measure protein n=1 Tax=Streptomyces hyaluromycini TaxID=1377993 RepID=UPI0011AE9280|nr:tape-measure protein [Streptomyces hyaluromycini]
MSGAEDRTGLEGSTGALRRMRSAAEATARTLTSSVAPFKDAATAADRIRSAAEEDTTALREAKARAGSADTALAEAGRAAAGAATGVKAAADKAGGGRDSLGKLALGVGGALALLGGLVTVTGPVATLMTALGVAMTVGSIAMDAINVGMRANPFGFVLALLVPLAGYLIGLALNSETGQRLTGQLAELILQYVQSCLTILTPIIKAIASAVNTYVTGYLTLITGVLTALGTLIGTGFAVLKALTTGDTRALSGKVSAVWNGFRSAVKPVLDWITRDIPRGFSRIKDATSRTLTAMGQFVTTGAQTVAGVIKGPIQGLIAFANWVIDGLNKLSFSFFGKKFGVHLGRIPMLAEGGIAVPGAARTGKVLPLTALARRHPTPAAQRPHRIEEFHESHGAGAHATATDLLFLASAHACA